MDDRWEGLRVSLLGFQTDHQVPGGRDVGVEQFVPPFVTLLHQFLFFDTSQFWQSLLDVPLPAQTGALPPSCFMYRRPRLPLPLVAGAIGYVSFFLICLCLSVSISLSGCSLRESAEFNIAVVVASLVVGDQLPRVISCEYQWLEPKSMPSSDHSSWGTLASVVARCHQ